MKHWRMGTDGKQKVLGEKEYPSAVLFTKNPVRTRRGSNASRSSEVPQTLNDPPTLTTLIIICVQCANRKVLQYCGIKGYRQTDKLQQ